LGLGIPVDHAGAAIDEPLCIQVDKDLYDRAVVVLVHGKGNAVPVYAATQLADLAVDDAAVFVLPLVGIFHELRTGELVLVDPFLRQHTDDLGLRGNGGVVAARNPAGVETAHPGLAHQDVLYRLVQGMTHVQYPRDVGGRDDDGKGRTSVRL